MSQSPVKKSLEQSLQLFRDSSSIEFSDVTPGAAGSDLKQRTTRKSALLNDTGNSPGEEEKDLEVFLDIQKTDWRFSTQSGALRRIIMNIFGNAIKYTAKGWIRTSVYAEGGGVIEFVLKPVGPYKLARALGLCLERAGRTKRNSSSYRPVSEVSSVGGPNVDAAIDDPCEATAEPEDRAPPSMNTHARDGIPVGEGGDDVPSATYISTVDMIDPPELDRVGFSLPSSGPSENGRGPEASSSDLHQSRQSAASVESLLSDVDAKTSDFPRILIVDDNKINLRLLKTFINKSGYHVVDSAEDGSLAVEAVEKSEGYDIIFMGMFINVML
ncbi:hypothetical protein B0A49_07552 [Cryomyces minteri]|uniref:Response regulatory domain-containing protein n=1 Tax=Cryomyces minteri TaxID=331657 RepID=A0A4U0X6F4_9PEZI|nr:hypothetical protein B0A49_07552 [Cryomyces minteri]